MWLCPHCQNEIDFVYYSVTERVWGTANLVRDRNESVNTCDFESNDSEQVDSPDYSCPECDQEICLDDLKPVEEAEEEEKPPALEEEKFAIVKPEKNLQLEGNAPDQSNHVIICRHCLYSFVYSLKKNNSFYDPLPESSVECPRCQKENDVQEYKKLLQERYFEKLKVKKLTKKRHAKNSQGRRLKPLV